MKKLKSKKAKQIFGFDISFGSDWSPAVTPVDLSGDGTAIPEEVTAQAKALSDALDAVRRQKG